jgi:hypothetical protein
MAYRLPLITKPMLIILTFWLVCWAPVVSAQQPANIQSPEIGADRRVTFRLNAPKAQEVVLTGEFLKRAAHCPRQRWQL